MLKVFNKVRIKAISESKLGKYLIYAVGEIALLVIGIFIALQINTSYQASVQLDKVNTYLKVLSEEVELNIDRIDKRVERIQRDLEQSANSLAQVNSKQAAKFNEEQLKNVTGTRPIANVIMARASFDDLINSGALEYLTDLALKKNILDIESLINKKQERYGHASDVWLNHHLPYLQKHSAVATLWDSINGVDIPKLPFTMDKSAFLQNREFSNILALRMRMMGNYQETLKEIKLELLSLSTNINNYLTAD
ncbi:hypothetical protein [Paraglaciecola sp.]|uniref:hypothetical protein n=1 Tax=Paraglaciecola sp. TaxID=1920173 RepID=UPI003EF4B405